MPITTMYRYEDVLYAASLNEYDEPSGPPQLAVRLSKFRVVRETPCGAWLDIGRFVKMSGRKRYAWPTEAEALESFKARKTRQLSILRAQAGRVERALAMVAQHAPQPADAAQQLD